MFGPDYIIPKPFDPRLILQVAPAVARAAMDTGLAHRPIADFEAYGRDLERFVFRSGQLMRPVFEAARQNLKRVVYAEGEDDRVLRAVQTVLDERLAQPILLGRRSVIERKAATLGLRLFQSGSLSILDPSEDHDLFDPLIRDYQRLVDRRGVPPEAAARRMLTRLSVAAAMLLHAGHADAALCGGTGDWSRHLSYILPVVRANHDAGRAYALSG